MPNRDPLASPTGETPRGPLSTPGIPDRTQDKPPLTPAQDASDTKNPQDPLDPKAKQANIPMGVFPES